MGKIEDGGRVRKWTQGQSTRDLLAASKGTPNGVRSGVSAGWARAQSASPFPGSDPSNNGDAVVGEGSRMSLERLTPYPTRDGVARGRRAPPSSLLSGARPTEDVGVAERQLTPLLDPGSPCRVERLLDLGPPFVD